MKVVYSLEKQRDSTQQQVTSELYLFYFVLVLLTCSYTPVLHVHVVLGDEAPDMLSAIGSCNAVQILPLSWC